MTISFSSSDELLYLNGKDLDMEWFHANGFKTPIIVKDPNGLDLTIPSYDFTVADVERYVGKVISGVGVALLSLMTFNHIHSSTLL